jgi:serine/threonine protein phosphatase 1
MRLTYVIPDLHGRYDLLNDALAGIAAHARGETGTIVTIGDYVDKGPDSKAVIDRLLPGAGPGWNLIALRGNHDAMMVEALRDPSKMAAWLGKGGDAALASYGGDPAGVPQTHIAWLEGLRPMYLDAHRLYVHAGVDPEIPLDRQSEATLLWKRYPKGYPDGCGKFHVVHGHDTFPDGYGDLHVVHGHDNFPDGPLLYPGRTNLDTLAWRTGRLTIGVFDDRKPGGPVDLIVVRGPPAGR